MSGISIYGELGCFSEFVCSDERLLWRKPSGTLEGRLLPNADRSMAARSASSTSDWVRPSKQAQPYRGPIFASSSGDCAPLTCRRRLSESRQRSH